MRKICVVACLAIGLFGGSSIASADVHRSLASKSLQSNLGKMMEERDLILYYKPSCPYCKKVIDYMDKNGISIAMEDTSDQDNERELVRLGGKRQVPCLIVDGSALYESSDIIDWLSKNASK
jgi:glutaredoxin 3